MKELKIHKEDLSKELKDSTLHLRVTAKEKEAIKKKAESLDMTVSDFVRLLAQKVEIN